MSIPTFNPFSTYGRLARPIGRGISAELAVCAATSTNQSTYQLQYPIDSDSAAGVNPVQATYAAATALTTSGHTDQILVSQDFTTAPTAAEVISMQTAGNDVRYMGIEVHPTMICYKPATTLPASGNATLFTVTGLIRLKILTGKVSTVIQTQACNLKLTAVPTDQTNLTNTDICSNLAISALKLNSLMYITGTLATALTNSAAGAVAFAPTDIIIQAGTIIQTTSATNTGAISWRIEYIPLEPGAYVY